jgi:hypothetical protein
MVSPDHEPAGDDGDEHSHDPEDDDAARHRAIRSTRVYWVYRVDRATGRLQDLRRAVTSREVDGDSFRGRRGIDRRGYDLVRRTAECFCHLARRVESEGRVTQHRSFDDRHERIGQRRPERCNWFGRGPFNGKHLGRG